MSDIQMIETVSFRTNAGVSDAKLIAAAETLANYIEACSGFLSRTLYKAEDGVWHEQYVWADAAAAKAADEGFMARPEAKALMTLIDKTSLTMAHAPATIARFKTPEMA